MSGSDALDYSPKLDLELGSRLGPFYETHGPEIIPVGYEEAMEPLAVTMGTYTVRSNLAECDGQQIVLGHYDLTQFIQEDWDRVMADEPARMFLISSRGGAYAAGRLAEEVVLMKLLLRATLLGNTIEEVVGFREARERGIVQGVTEGKRSDDLILIFRDGQLGALESKASFRPTSSYLKRSARTIEAQLTALLRVNPHLSLVFATRIDLTQHTIEIVGSIRNRFLADGLPWLSL